MRLALSLLLTLFCIGDSWATPITYAYTGTVTSASGSFAGQGNAIVGSFTFDDGLVDVAVGGIRDRFDTNSFYNTALLSTWTASLDVGAVSVSLTATATANVVDASLHLDDTDSGAPDNILYGITGPTSGGTNFYFALQGKNLINPGVSNLTSTIAGAVDILNSVDFSLVESTYGQWIEPDGSKLFFTIQSLSNADLPVSVPEPATFWLLFSGTLVLLPLARFRQLKRRISLTNAGALDADENFVPCTNGQ